MQDILLGTECSILLVVPISHTHYSVPPVGLGYLSTALKTALLNDIGILDCVKEKFNFKKFSDFIEKLKPKVIGFSLFSYDFESVKKSISIVKEVLPNSIVLVGGPHVSATRENVLVEMGKADFAFVGEGEIGVPLLINKLIRKKKIDFEDIPGLVWRDSQTIKVNDRAVIECLDDLGFPDWELMPPIEYSDSPQGAFYKNLPIAPILTSRGCPYHCTFCGSGVNMGHKLRLRSINHVLKEMDVLIHKFGVREFHIIDDMFNFIEGRVFEFCEGIKDRKWDISYTFPNGLRLNQLNREMLIAMKETGLYSFTVGIESGSERVLKEMHKGLTLEQIEKKVDLINEVGLEPSGFFIVGYPTETVQDIRATINFAKKLKIKRAHFSNFLPLPGTPSTKKLIEKGEINKVDWSDLFYSKVPYSPQGIKKGQLKRLQRSAFLEFYLRPQVLFKFLLEIKTIGHFKSIMKRAVDYLFYR